MKIWNITLAVSLLVALASTPAAWGSIVVTIDTSSAGKRQTIDGFGTSSSYNGPLDSWYPGLYLDDLRCSIVRVDMTPQFVSPYSDNTYNAPWFGNQPDFPGPDGNNVRTYTGVSGGQPYTRSWSFKNSSGTTVNQAAQIAVMGTNIDNNVKLLNLTQSQLNGAQLAQLAQAKLGQLGDFKLIGAVLSPSPWLKISSGNTYSASSGDPYPTNGTPFPFMWGNNYGGGLLDTSGTAIAAFNDGTQNTSALTQFARTVSASLRSIQNQYGVKFYAISIQNELSFEEYYNSCYYQLSSQYIAAVKAMRTELNQYQDLSGILIEGPEDVLGSSSYEMWQTGNGSTAAHRNLQFIANVENDPVASADLAFYSIHGYGANGVTSSGSSSPTSWNWWTQGWTSSPAAGLPTTVKGFSSFNKRSWMTESSGETAGWLDSSTTGGFPDSGAFSIALKLHQTLTAGQESAYVYLDLYNGKSPDIEALTDGTALANAPKYVAAKHFFRYIRPNSYRVNTTVAGSSTVLASSYVNDTNLSLTTVLINSAASAATAVVNIPAYPANLGSFQVFTSSNGSYWQSSTATVSGGQVTISLPAYSVATMTAAAPITGQPQNQTATLGSTVSFGVTASGTGLTYQWQYNGTPITGQTAATLSLTGLTQKQAGAYNVVVTNAAGTVTSAAATLTVQANYTQWSNQYFTVQQQGNTAVYQPGDIPQNDGVPNLLKYLFDINPSRPMTSTDRAALPVVGTTPGSPQYLTLTYRQNPMLIGYVVNVQTSPDLLNWTTANPPDIFQPTGAVDAATGDPFMEIGVKLTGSRQFIRLKIAPSP